MKNLFLLPVLLFTVANLQAQDCSQGRYDQELFTDLDITSDIQYGSNINYNGSSQDLLLDIYQPNGDTDTDRALIIFIHGGTFITGSKEGGDVVPLAKTFAKKGYVTSSINYRLGMNNLISQTGPSEGDASEAVMRATHDARAAVRFFKKSVADESNPYGIDTTNIFLVGSSAGGFTALHLSYLDQLSEIPSYINMSHASLEGGIEGKSGNPGHTSNVRAIVNISGALGDTTWMDNNSTPVLSFHGDNDGTVPFNTGLISIAFFDIMEVDGSESVHIKAENQGIKNCFKAEYGADHVPHQNNAAYLDTTEQYITQFLLSEVCGETHACLCDTPTDPIPCHPLDGTAGIDQEELAQLLSIYPNPAKNTIKVELNEYTIENISVIDSKGKLIFLEYVNGEKTSIDTSQLNAGIYSLKIKTAKGMVSKRVVVE